MLLHKYVISLIVKLKPNQLAVVRHTQLGVVEKYGGSLIRSSMIFGAFIYKDAPLMTFLPVASIYLSIFYFYYYILKIH